MSGNPSASAIAPPTRCQLGLRPLLTGRLERQADDELVDPLRRHELGKRGRVVGELPAPPDRVERPRRRTVAVGDGQPDPALPEVDPQQAPHGAALWLGAAEGSGDSVSDAGSPLGPTISTGSGG